MNTVTDTGLLTDRYELTMLSACLADGTANNRAVFEAFARRLPPGRRFGMVAGLGRLLPLIENFRFDRDEIAWLLDEGAITPAAAEYLKDYAFSGDIWAYPEGSVYWPNSPVLAVEGTLAECMILETLILSVLNHDSAVASAAARMTLAAGGRPMIEMGSRRVHEEAAVAAARAAYVAGFESTSNLAAGRRWGIPTVGTAAHAFTLAHSTEREAFRSQMEAFGTKTTLLVDTYDTAVGIRTAVEVAQELGAAGPGAIRLDSGDLATEAHWARALLDSMNAWSTKVTVTSDLDEYLIYDLAQAPIDGYGVGTRLSTGSGHPTAGMVYKLVAVSGTPEGPLRPVAKRSKSKASVGGRKHPWRLADRSEVFAVGHRPPEGKRLIQEQVVNGGTVLAQPTLAEARERAHLALTYLPAEAQALSDGDAFTEATLYQGDM